MAEPLPDTLPEDPMPIVAGWIADAERAVTNAMAMTVATVEPDGRPTARMIICRGFDPDAGWFVFYTDRDSPKARAIETAWRAALVFYWDPLGRQVRIEGPVTTAPEAQTDAYWRSRPLDARHAAITTVQSRPLASRADLRARLDETVRRVGDAAPRPDRWIGYRVWAERVELWVSQPARLHDRAAWTRALTRAGDAYTGDQWSATRLEP